MEINSIPVAPSIDHELLLLVALMVCFCVCICAMVSPLLQIQDVTWVVNCEILFGLSNSNNN
jgi:hypothetical protein